jgi:hypothetical protein
VKNNSLREIALGLDRLERVLNDVLTASSFPF